MILPGTIEVEQEVKKCPRDVRPPRKPGIFNFFLGLRNAYRSFVWNYSDFFSPMYALLKRTPFPKQLQEYDGMQIKEYRALIKAVIEPPVLEIPIQEILYSIETNVI